MDTIKSYWFNSVKNFGDILGPKIIKHLSGKDAVYSGKPSGRILTVGSIMHCARSGDIVWGSGLHHKTSKCQKGVNVVAARGPRSKSILDRLGFKNIKAFGDPAVLLPYIFKVDVKVKYDIGIIPHYVDHKRILDNVKDTNINIINIKDDVENVIKEICKCRNIFSSSMHGIIAAEAYDIPTVWLQISDKISSKTWKYWDYYESTGRSNMVCIDWRNKIDIDNTLSQISRFGISQYKDHEKLLMSFPYLKSDIKGINDVKPNILGDE